MAAPMTEEAKIVLKLLDDGRWHAEDEVLLRLAVAVQPGKAIRTYQQRADAHHARHGERVGPPLSDSDQVASGQRQLARRALRSLRLRYLETRVVDGETQIRKREVPLPIKPTRRATCARCETLHECDHCGALVADLDMHSDDYHPPYDHPPYDRQPESPIDTRTLVTDAHLRLIIRTELVALLDQFQGGLQEYLQDRFAALEQPQLPSLFQPRLPTRVQGI